MKRAITFKDSKQSMRSGHRDPIVDDEASEGKGKGKAAARDGDDEDDDNDGYAYGWGADSQESGVVSQPASSQDDDCVVSFDLSAYGGHLPSGLSSRTVEVRVTEGPDGRVGLEADDGPKDDYSGGGNLDSDDDSYSRLSFGGGENTRRTGSLLKYELSFSQYLNHQYLNSECNYQFIDVACAFKGPGGTKKKR